MPGPDEIHIASLELRIRIGVTDRERAEPQRLTVTLTLRPAGGFHDLDDEIAHTINYSAVCAAVRELAAEAAPRRLIETFASDIASTVLARFPACAEVDVELRKYILADTDYVAVRLTRGQPPPRHMKLPAKKKSAQATRRKPTPAAVVPQPRREPARLIVAASESDADMLYATRFYVPDAFLLLVQNGRSTVLLSDLEVDRGRKQATVDEVLSLSEFIKENKQVLGRKPAFARVVAHFLKTRRVRRAVVPENFPLGLSRVLANGGVEVAPPKTGLFWPARLHKTPQEIGHLRKALEITAAGMRRGVEVLAAARGPGGRKAATSGAELHWGGSILTSERLRAEIESAILHAGGLPANTIVAGGEQACDPHERGSGPLRAGELIILDIFPRDAASGYYGDMTRTVVKGRATDAQRQLWLTVQEGQRRSIAATRAGADGKKIHEATKKYFKEQGFPTEMRDGRHVGFFHGTGHGLGLEIHEAPRFQLTRSMEKGMVITIEPGLYFPGLGGVRIEDVVAVTAKGCDVLSHFEQQLEI